jgi:hypothetical protein
MLHVNQLIGFGASGRARRPLEFVGGAISAKAGATSGNSTVALDSGLTGGVSSAAEAEDLVIAVFSSGSTADRTLSITDGTDDYTLIGSELYANDSVDVNLRVAYKFVSGDTAVTFGPTGNADDGGVTAVYVFRGVDQGTPLDVTPTTATGTDTVLANPPAITPVTPGAFIVCVGAGASLATGSTTFASSDLTGFRTIYSSDLNDNYLGIGHKNNWVSGAFNAAAFTLATGSDSSGGSWAALTFSLRPE